MISTGESTGSRAGQLSARKSGLQADDDFGDTEVNCQASAAVVFHTEHCNML